MNELLIVSVGIVIITLVSVPVVAAPGGGGSSPIEQILTIVTGIQTNVQTILTDVATIKDTTAQIADKLGPANSAAQILTRSKSVTFAAGTPKQPYTYLAQVFLWGPLEQDKAGDFNVRICVFSRTEGDWTVGTDMVEVVGGVRDGAFTVSEKRDSELTNGCWTTEFPGSSMEIGVRVGDTLPKDVTVSYSYTVTTDSETRISEDITTHPA